MSKTIQTKMPWVEKYRPKSIKEMALPTAKVGGNRVDLAEELINFVKSFFVNIKKINEENKKIRQFNRTASEKEQKEEIRIETNKAALLLEGPPGIGKTSIVYALANDLNMEVIETNASDTRTKDAIEKKLKETISSKGIMNFVTGLTKKLILIDEVDGIYGNRDRGAVPSIISLIKSTQFPIIMCSNEYKQRLQTLYKLVRRFEVHPLSKDETLRITKNILKNESVTNLNAKDLELIIDKNSGDLRGVINDLQGICQGSSNKDNTDLILTLRRDTTEEIFGLIRDLFQKVKTLREAQDLINKSDVDYNFLYKWINENLPTFITINKEIADAYENLSLADLVFGRIRRNMYWALLPYFFDLFGGGVVLSRKKSPTEGFRRVVFPRFRSSGSLNNTEKNLIKKIKLKYDISQNEVMRDFLPFLKILSSSSRQQLKNISDWLDLEAKEKKLLKIN